MLGTTTTIYLLLDVCCLVIMIYIVYNSLKNYKFSIIPFLLVILAWFLTSAVYFESAFTQTEAITVLEQNPTALMAITLQMSTSYYILMLNFFVFILYILIYIVIKIYRAYKARYINNKQR